MKLNCRSSSDDTAQAAEGPEKQPVPGRGTWNRGPSGLKCVGEIPLYFYLPLASPSGQPKLCRLSAVWEAKTEKPWLAWGPGRRALRREKIGERIPWFCTWTDTHPGLTRELHTRETGSEKHREGLRTNLQYKPLSSRLTSVGAVHVRQTQTTLKMEHTWEQFPMKGKTTSCANLMERITSNKTNTLQRVLRGLKVL